MWLVFLFAGILYEKRKLGGFYSEQRACEGDRKAGFYTSTNAMNQTVAKSGGNDA